MIPIEVVKSAAHTADSVAAERDRRLGGYEFFARVEFPREVVRTYTSVYADVAVIVEFAVEFERAAVNKVYADYVSDFLGRKAVAYRHKRVLMVRGRAADRSRGIYALKEFLTGDVTFGSPRAGQCYEIIAEVFDVEVETICAIEKHDFVRSVFDFDGTCDRVDTVVKSVVKVRFDFFRFVFERNTERFAVAAMRKSAVGFYDVKFVSRVAEIGYSSAVFVADGERRNAVVALSVRGYFERRLAKIVVAGFGVRHIGLSASASPAHKIG